MKKLLLVEDNEMNRDMLKRRLERRHFAVAIARDGQAAIEMAVKHSPDLILMDMSLPAVDGWEATRQIKANMDTHEIPIIALTAHALEGDRECALAAGCDEYEPKPIDFPSLVSKIEHLLESTEHFEFTQLGRIPR